MTSATSDSTRGAQRVLDLRVSKTYHGRLVLGETQIQVSRGEAVGVYGRNASGKSTMLRIIAGMLSDDTGTRYSPNIVVGFIPQDPLHTLFPWMSSWNNVVAHHGKSCSRHDAIRLLATLGFDGVAASASSFPLALSGGMRQRLAWACALRPDVGLLVLDEPFSEQDTEWTDRLCRRVRECVSNGVAAVIVAHELELLAMTCDRILLMPDPGRHTGVTRVRDVPRGTWTDSLEADAVRFAAGLQLELLDHHA